MFNPNMSYYVEGNLIVYYYGGNEAPAPFPLGSGTGAQIFNDIVKTALSSGQKFEDPNFAADSSSIAGETLSYSDSGSTSSNASSDTMDIKWFRPTEIAKTLFNADPIFHGPYNEFAVVQGDLGDCWWLSVLADIATKPECINTIVPADNETVGWDAGVFHFRFWCRGEWIDVVVDDRLPCVVDNNQITGTLNTHPTANGGFWVPLLEKAYAKLYGTYEDISGGNSTDAMLDFTGGFPVQFFPSINQYFKQAVKNSHKLNALISFSTKESSSIASYLNAPHDSSDPGPEGVTTTGIVLGHEYSMLDIQDVQDKNDSTHVYTLLKLRNPWGNKTVWTGNFSYTDPNNIWDTVTPDLRDRTGKRNDGEFWIEYEDFQTYFNEIDIGLWSGKYRGYKTEKTPDGAESFITHGYFTAQNSGDHSRDNLKHKPGFYAYLKPTDPSYNLNDEISKFHGLDCTCGVHITMLYSNYTNTDGTKPDIEQYGFFIFWAPGNINPNDGDKIYHHEIQNGLTSQNRSTICYTFVPEGTILIIPWITNSPPTDTSTPYYLRIAVDGDVEIYNPN